MSIPIANVYYLMTYAWRHAQHQHMADAGAQSATTVRDLLGHLLAHEVGRLVSRGLAREYVPVGGRVAGVRGKLDVGTTIKQNLLQQAQTHCEYDEMVHDVPRNRIVKSTLRTLLRIGDLDARVRERVRHVHAKLDAVSEIPLTRRHFAGFQSSRHVRDYAFVLQLCLLIFDSVLLEEGGSGVQFRDFREDEARMAQLFEEFIYRFYDVEAPQFSVSRPQIRWHAAEGSEADLAVLPVMQTDVVLSSPDRVIVLDAKYYQEALTRRFGRNRVRSAHLYQLFAYLENRTAALPGRPHDGILLYPVVEEPFQMTYRLKGQPISVRSIDLSGPWDCIRQDLLAIVA